MFNNEPILLVEDDDIDAESLSRAFKKHNVTNPLHRCVDGLDAWEYLQTVDSRTMPSVAFLDINMPRMTGIELLRKMRAHETLNLIPVIILTTSEADRDVVAAYGMHVAGYVLKPLNFPKFAEAVATLNMYWSMSKTPSR